MICERPALLPWARETDLTMRAGPPRRTPALRTASLPRGWRSGKPGQPRSRREALAFLPLRCCRMTFVPRPDIAERARLPGHGGRDGRPAEIILELTHCPTSTGWSTPTTRSPFELAGRCKRSAEIGRAHV